MLLVAGDADDPDSGTSTAVSVVLLALGLLFLVMALKQWRGRPKAGETPEMPRWMSAVDHFTPVKSLGLGVLLSGAQPEEPRPDRGRGRLHRPGGAGRRREHRGRHHRVRRPRIGDRGGRGACCFLLGGDRATAPLASVKEFMTDNNAVIMMVILLVLGAKLSGTASRA